MQTTISSAVLLGKRVKFAFGVSGEVIAGTVVSIRLAPHGQSFAWVAVDGFPAWKHREPIENLQPENGSFDAFRAVVLSKLAA